MLKFIIALLFAKVLSALPQGCGVVDCQNEYGDDDGRMSHHQSENESTALLVAKKIAQHATPEIQLANAVVGAAIYNQKVVDHDVTHGMNTEVGMP